MKNIAFISSLFFLFTVSALWSSRKAVAGAPKLNRPSYTADGKLVLPANYREWVYLSTGLGMNYSKDANANPQFTNVFVSRKAYDGFKATAKWPDKSMFVLEIYSPATHGSINKSGQYQDKLMGLDIEVKDSSRPEEWSYYNFDPGKSTGELVGPGCNSCHEKNAAVEHTFVQFYPTLLEFAVSKNLIKPGVDIH